MHTVTIFGERGTMAHIPWLAKPIRALELFWIIKNIAQFCLSILHREAVLQWDEGTCTVKYLVVHYFVRLFPRFVYFSVKKIVVMTGW